MPDSPQFDTDRTCPGRWTITFNNPPINMFVPATIVELGALMADLEADPSVKVVVFQSANSEVDPIVWTKFRRFLDGAAGCPGGGPKAAIHSGLESALGSHPCVALSSYQASPLYCSRE